MYYLSALIMGMIGSLHCVGMCGPIVMALPLGDSRFARVLSGRLLYNLGRVMTYSVLGLTIGIFGQGLAFAGYQQTLSIVAGVFMLIIALFSWDLESRLWKLPVLSQFVVKLKMGLGKMLKRTSMPAMLSIGILNGLLPCGFVYMGLAGAVAAGSALGSAGYMALFGLGTVPTMLVFALAGRFISAKARSKFKPVVTVFMFLFGLWLIVRGMNLGIPFLSPYVAGGEAAVCH